ncbi:peptidoglycan recognition protein family protein [Paenibacillus macerans]|uniref:peptidoglycan recognition protein family protein n=1 Tax=Paenibacillus macerans TaxID=44252 RepID=UPI003D322B64
MDTSKYKIERRYVAKRSNVRPGTRLLTGAPEFFVAHDTGNPGATAENHYAYFNSQNDRSASAHVFIDDTKVLEIIPTGTGSDPAEKAWHVLYDVTTDNDRFGYDANDAAIGVELCYGGRINFTEAYKRYVWYLAYCCSKWNKNPYTFIPSHKQLDPARRRDAEQALATGGKTLKNLLDDISTEMNATRTPSPTPNSNTSFTPLPASIAQSLIDNYVSPAWLASQVKTDQVGMTHFHNLANNLRVAAGIPLASASSAGPLIPLPKSNAQEIIFRWLSPAWFKARGEGNGARAQHFNNLANYLRRAAGIPEQ